MKGLLFYKKKSYEIRKILLEKFFLLKEGHPGSVFSILDVLLVLYYEKFVRINKNQTLDDVIMSKGHATVGQYPILNDLGVIADKDWKNWGKNQNTSLKMFGNNNISGIKTATGSLGHGIGFGTGIAYANQKKNKKNVYVIISEGELYEGSTWEALILLGSLKLRNVTIILDVNNNIILGDPRNLLNLGNMRKKIQSFDIFTDECNGHDFLALNKKLLKHKKINKPTCLIVNTVKGKGFNFMENKSNWHYWNPMSINQYNDAIEKLRIKYDQ